MSQPATPPAVVRRESTGYLERSELPLTSLVFLLPLIVAYELGSEWVLRQPGGEQNHIIAFSLLQKFFGLFGATGRHLPALAVVGVLLSWHIARNDAWKVRPLTLLGMAIESAVLALPLMVLGYALLHYFSRMAAGDADAGLVSKVVLSMGAGIYEELVFRLIGFTVLSLFLRDMLRLPHWLTVVTMIFVSAVLFAAYHHLGSETFDRRTFLFRSIAGIYFGVILLARGFGITAGTHAAYDILISLLR